MTLYLLFFLSGASGLIYQVVWVREFGNVFGNTIHSAALVVGIFMGGLGLGSYLAGIWADRRYAARAGSLLGAYGWVELAIGLLGVVISGLLPRLGDLAAAISTYTRDAQGWYVLSAGSTVAGYAIAVVLLTPSTVLMGGTLTLLIRHRVQQELEAAGWRIGALYGVNTAGAALGCFLTDWAFIPNAGLAGTQMIAVAFNLVAGLGARQLARRDRPAAPAAAPVPRPAAPVSGPRLLVGAAIFLSGFVAMGMEIVWFRHLITLFGSYRAVLSLILTVILVGIWLGSVAGGWLHRRFGRPAVFYMLAQAGFVVATLGGLATADVGRILAEHSDAYETFLAASPWKREALQLWLHVRPVLREIAVPALLMGFAYPLANASIQDAERAVGRRAGSLYLANTAGAVLGSLAAGFLLLPALGMQRSVAVLALVAAVGLLPLGLAARRLAGDPAACRPATAASLASGVAMAAAIAVWLVLPADYLIQRALAPVPPGERRLAVSEGIGEVIAVMEHRDRGRMLVTNGHPMSGTWWVDQRYMRAFAHIPLLSLEAPARALVICFGVGNTAHAAALHPSVRRIDVVDTSRHVLEHARYFRATNGGILDDPRVAVYVNDGRHHLRMQPAAIYDMITLEPPPIAFAGVASLYSREFYALARSRLTPGGYLTQWLPAYQVPEYATLALVRAFVDVFPQSVLLSGSMNELILMGVNGDSLEIDPQRLRARLAAAPAAREDLARHSLGTPLEIMGTFAGSASVLAAATEPALPVTDDYPINEYVVGSRLVANRVPYNLFDVSPVRGVGAWCPRCFVNGRPAPGLELLPNYLWLLRQMYAADAFLEYYWPYRPAGKADRVHIRIDSVSRRLIEASPYLQTVFPTLVRRANGRP